MRALAAVHGPLGLVHIDSHTDLWDTYDGLPYGHGTMSRRAIEEGVLDPGRVIQAGMHGPLYGEADEQIPATLGVETIPWVELAELSPAAFAERVLAVLRERGLLSPAAVGSLSPPTQRSPAR